MLNTQISQPPPSAELTDSTVLLVVQEDGSTYRATLNDFAAYLSAPLVLDYMTHVAPNSHYSGRDGVTLSLAQASHAQRSHLTITGALNGDSAPLILPAGWRGLMLISNQSDALDGFTILVTQEDAVETGPPSTGSGREFEVNHGSSQLVYSTGTSVYKLPMPNMDLGWYAPQYFSSLSANALQFKGGTLSLGPNNSGGTGKRAVLATNAP